MLCLQYKQPKKTIVKISTLFFIVTLQCTQFSVVVVHIVTMPRKQIFVLALWASCNYDVLARKSFSLAPQKFISYSTWTVIWIFWKIFPKKSRRRQVSDTFHQPWAISQDFRCAHCIKPFEFLLNRMWSIMSKNCKDWIIQDLFVCDDDLT